MSRRVKAIQQLHLDRLSMKASIALNKQEVIIHSDIQYNIQARRLNMCLRCQDKNMPCTGPNGIFGCSFCAVIQAKCRWLDLEKLMQDRIAEETADRGQECQEYIASAYGGQSSQRHRQEPPPNERAWSTEADTGCGNLLLPAESSTSTLDDHPMTDGQSAPEAAYPTTSNDNIFRPLVRVTPQPNVEISYPVPSLHMDEAPLNGIYDTASIGDPSPFAPRDDSLPPSGSIISALTRFFFDASSNESNAAAGISSNSFETDTGRDLATFDDSSLEFAPPLPASSSTIPQRPSADASSSFDGTSRLDFVPESNQCEMHTDFSFPSMSNEAFTFESQMAYSTSPIPFPDFRNSSSGWVYVPSNFEYLMNDNNYGGLPAQA